MGSKTELDRWKEKWIRWFGAKMDQIDRRKGGSGRRKEMWIR